MSDDQRDVDALLGAISEQARVEGERILAEAREQATSIRTLADRRIEQMTEQHEMLFQSRLRSERDRILGASRLGRNSRLLALRRRLVDAVFDEVEGRLKGLTGSKDYASIFPEVVRAAVTAFGQGAQRVLVAREDADLARVASGECTVEAADLPRASVRVSDAAGERLLDAGPHTQARLGRTRLAAEVAQILFREHDET